MPELREITSGLLYPEGPVAMDDGSVIVTELQTGRLVRVQPDGTKDVVAELGGSANGAAVGPDGLMYVCNNGGLKMTEVDGKLIPAEGLPDDYTGGSIQRVDITTGAVATLYTECDGHRLRGPNDLVFDAAGGFWFTDFGKVQERSKDRGGVYYAKTDGSSITEMVHPIDGPNGVGLAPGDTTLYVAQEWELSGPGEFAATDGGDGQLLTGPGGGKLLTGLPGYQLLDSMAVDSAGNVCVATLMTSGISVISPDGASVEHLPTPDPLTTNICFGGPDLATAYITLTSLGTLVAMDWPRPGLKLHYTR
ncbi:MAG: SMP-30/gluconolactonase/LRE family protein [Desulfurellaceae bacterium]|nr:SMP-30/gluconolactonase/LRE family protein [Desulfurellaceae bacterium]